MSNYDILKCEFDKKINPKVITKIEGENLTIIEENKGATGKEVKIEKIKNALTLHLDDNKRKIYFMKVQTKINDTTILYVAEQKLYILLLELKSKNVNTAKDQIKYGKIYSDFIVDVLRQDSNIKFNNIEYRGYIFRTDRKTGLKTSSIKQRNIMADDYKDGIYFKTFDNNAKYDFKTLILPISYNNGQAK